MSFSNSYVGLLEGRFLAADEATFCVTLLALARIIADVYSLDADIVELLHDVFDLKLVGVRRNRESEAVLLLAVGIGLLGDDWFDLDIHVVSFLEFVNDCYAVLGHDNSVVVEQSVCIEIHGLHHQGVGHVAHRQEHIAVNTVHDQKHF